MLDIYNPFGFAILALISVGTLVFLFLSRSKAKKRNDARKRLLEYHGMANPFWSTFMGKPVEMLEMEFAKKYGSLYACYLFGNFTIMCTEPEFNQMVLSTEFTNFTDHRVRVQ